MGILRFLSKVPGLIWFLAGGGIGFFFWLHEHDKAVANKARAEVLAHATDSLQAIVDSAIVARTAQARRDSIHRAEDQNRIASAERKIAVSEAKARTIADRIRSQLSDSTRDLVDSLEAQHQASLWEKDSIIAAERRIRERADSALAKSDSALFQIRQVNELLRKQLTLTESRANRNLWEQITDKAPWVAGAFLIGRFAK
jgi:hypothetical protein